MEFSRRQLLTASAALALWPDSRAKTEPVASSPPPPMLAPRRYPRRGRRCSCACIGPYSDAVLVHGQPPPTEPGSFTIAVLPDTQYYSEEFPEVFLSQTAWIVDNWRERNIACVLHLGDVTNRNSPIEWERAAEAMAQLDGKVPYFMVPGNHDYGRDGRCTDRQTLMSDYFPVSEFQTQPTFGGVYDQEPDRIENSFHFFEAQGQKFMVLGLEFGPRLDVVRWANEVVEAHQDHSVILITHAYTYFNNTRYDWHRFGKWQHWNPHNYEMAWATEDDVCDGEELWRYLVSRHENIVLTLNGHVLGNGLGHVTSQTPGGRRINQLLVNFQMRPQGGDGWLRLMEFRPDGKTVQVYDYSPTRDQRNISRKNQFAFALPGIATT